MQRLRGSHGKTGVQMQTTACQGFVAAQEGKDTVKEHANTTWKYATLKTQPCTGRADGRQRDGPDMVNLILNDGRLQMGYCQFLSTLPADLLKSVNNEKVTVIGYLIPIN